MRILTEAAGSPIAKALHLSRSENNTRVCLAGRHGHRRTTTTKADRREICTHLVCSVADVARSPATEAPVTSSPPTHERTIVQDGAHMIVARTECACGAARAKVDCRKRSWRHALGGVAKAKLAAGVGAPTRDGEVVEQRTREVFAGRNGACGAASAKVDCGQCVAHFANTVAARVGVAITQLAVRTAAPTLDGEVVEQRTRVLRTNRNGRCGAARAKVYFGQRVAHFACAVAARNGVAVTQASVCAESPTFDGEVVEQRTRMRRANRDGSGCPPKPELYRRRCCY